MEAIPFYCGYGDSTCHGNHYDCFVHESRKNGSIVWEGHGTC
ncbi:PCYCGC motif-containing (lipo)protein [Peribacillus sp. SCS-155]